MSRPGTAVCDLNPPLNLHSTQSSSYDGFRFRCTFCGKPIWPNGNGFWTDATFIIVEEPY